MKSIAGEEDGNQDNNDNDAFETGKLEALTAAQLKEIIRALSQDRRKLNRKLESLNKELELNAAKLESLRLVGGEDESTLKRIGELNDAGQVLSEELSKIDEKIKWSRLKQEELVANPG